MEKAQAKNIIDVRIHDIRSFCDDAHLRVDDRPFGGGPGMVLKVGPIYRALKNINALPGQIDKDKEKVVLLSPRGSQYNQKTARCFSVLDRVVLISGRYEGVDARVESFVSDVVSVGPYILSGGEIPSMVIVESVSRLLHGYMGNPDSVTKPSTNDISDEVCAEYPVYTRPEKFVTDEGETLDVPKVLTSGNHSAIEKWRKGAS